MKPAFRPIFPGLAIGLCIITTWGAVAWPAPPESFTISRCDQPFLYGFGTWKKAETAFAVGSSGIHITAASGQGGAGTAGLNLQTATLADWTPALTLAVGPQNKAAALNLMLRDADETGHQYKFDLRGLKPGVAQRVVAEFGASLAEPQSIEKPGATGLGGHRQLRRRRRLECS